MSKPVFSYMKGTIGFKLITQNILKLQSKLKI